MTHTPPTITGYKVRYQVVYPNGTLGDFYQRTDAYSRDGYNAKRSLRRFLQTRIIHNATESVQLVSCDKFSCDHTSNSPVAWNDGNYGADALESGQYKCRDCQEIFPHKYCLLCRRSG